MEGKDNQVEDVTENDVEANLEPEHSQSKGNKTLKNCICVTLIMNNFLEGNHKSKNPKTFAYMNKLAHTIIMFRPF